MLSFDGPSMIADILAGVLVESPWSSDELARRTAALLGPRRFVKPLVSRLLARFGTTGRPLRAHVARFLCDDRVITRAYERRRVARLSIPGPDAVMWPAFPWPVPSITTDAALAERLNVSLGMLDWYADVQHRCRRAADARLQHYDYRWAVKRTNSARLIEAPKLRLKTIQRQLLEEILTRIPPHEAAHGFRPGRSVKSHVAPHVGRSLVMRLDLRDFFPSIGFARVLRIFVAAGYPERVARLLSGLCTNSVPNPVLRRVPVEMTACEETRMRNLYRRRHLPQGAPTSPALANLCAYRLDCRLSGLARAVEARYTRYADDLVFSGDETLRRSARHVYVRACAIALEEGFEIQTRKTRLMHQGVRQQVAGVVLNDRLNVPRVEFDRLKATLHNCVRTGPAAQDREGHHDFRAHLLGRIGHVAHLNPDRGRRLRALFDQIVW